MNGNSPIYVPPFDIIEWFNNLEITPETIIVSCIVGVIIILIFGPIQE